MKGKQNTVIEVSWAHRVLCASGELEDDGLYQLGHINPSNVIYVSCGTTVLVLTLSEGQLILLTLIVLSTSKKEKLALSRGNCARGPPIPPPVRRC